jgi:hypothetical protein
MNRGLHCQQQAQNRNHRVQSLNDCLISRFDRDFHFNIDVQSSKLRVKSLTVSAGCSIDRPQS